MKKETHEKTFEEMTYEELVEMIALELHSALLVGGGKEMKRTLHMWLGQVIRWDKSQKPLDFPTE